MIDQLTKICKTCRIEKDRNDFYPVRKGLHPSCKDCVKLYNRNRYHIPKISEQVKLYAANKRKTDPEYVRRELERSDKFYNSIHGRALTLLNGARQRANKRNEDFTVTYEHIRKALERGFCPMTGYMFVISRHNEKGMNPYAPSIDRIDRTKPYSNENSRIVIWQYNMAKGQLTDSEFLEICLAVVEYATTD